MTPLLVTRAAEEAAELCARLGPHAVPAPCIAFVPAPEPRPELGDADLLVTSPRAVGPLAAAGIPASWRVLALAPTTASALAAAGLPVHVALPGGAAALALAARPDAPLVAVTSDRGGDEVRRVRLDAHLWVLYRTVTPADLPAAARAAMEGPFDVLFASPSAVDGFVALAPGALERARRVWFHGETTRAALGRYGREAERFLLPAY